MNQIRDIAFQSSKDIKLFQENELKRLLSYVLKHSVFYKRLFEENDLEADSIQTLEDLNKIPFTTKQDIQLHNSDFLCVDRSDVAEYMSTSGTLGKSVMIALTEKDLERLAYNECMSFAGAGIEKKDLVQLMLTLDRQFMAGAAYYEGIKKLGAAVLRVGPGLAAMQWEMIQRMKPTAIVAVPSFIVKLLEFAEEKDIVPNNTSVHTIICIGEPIRDSEFNLNILGKRISEKWNVRLVSTYASTEMQTAFTECTHLKGGHLHPDLLIVEVLDENNIPVKANEPGEIVITTLGIEGMPLLRYKTGDIARLHTESCECGRNTPRLGPIIGRKQQMVKLKGTTVYPASIFDIIHQCMEVRDFAVEVLRSEWDTDLLRVSILSDDKNKDVVINKLNEAFRSHLRVIPEIQFVDRTKLDSLHNSTQGRKLVRFIDIR